MFRVKIITPEKCIFDDEVRFVEFRTVDGAMGTLQNRAPLLTAMAISELEVEKKDGVRDLFAVHGGIAEFSNNTFTVLSDASEHSEEIDVERAKNALELAKTDLEGIEDAIRKKHAEAKLQRALLRLRVAKRK